MAYFFQGSSNQFQLRDLQTSVSFINLIYIQFALRNLIHVNQLAYAKGFHNNSSKSLLTNTSAVWVHQTHSLSSWLQKFWLTICPKIKWYICVIKDCFTVTQLKTQHIFIVAFWNFTHKYCRFVKFLNDPGMICSKLLLERKTLKTNNTYNESIFIIVATDHDFLTG